MLKSDLLQGTKNKLRKLSRDRQELLSSISREDIRLVYTFTEKLGSGSYGSVRIAHKTVNSDENMSFSVKSIKRENIEKSKLDEDELI